jgi:hypothetical protein
MSELKTNTYTFFNYLIDTAGIVPEEGQESLKLEEVEVAVGDYSDDFSQDPAAAVAFIKSAQVKDIPKDGVDLHTLDTDQARLLRRALNSLIDAPNPAAVEDTPRLIAFVPEMTPTIVRYLVAAYSVAPEAAIAILDKWVSLNSLNDWQRSWILFAIHHLGALDPKTSGDVNLRLRWTLAARTEAHSPITQVSASLALARSSLMTFSDLMNDFEHAPPAVSMQALAALRESFESNDSKANRARLMAVANSSELFKAVLIDANP